MKLLGLDGGTSAGSSSAGGNFLQKLLGIGGGQSIGGTPNFNPNSFTGGNRSGGGFFNFGGSSSSNSIQELTHLFGGGSGNSPTHELAHLSGGKSGGSGLAGVLALGGAAAGIIGSLIGGRAGGFLSSIRAGVSIGSIFGPLGALVGGGVGALFGLFGGDPKKKADKKQLPQLNQGFTDAVTQFSQLIKDVKALRLDGDSALSKGTELRAQVASGKRKPSISSKIIIRKFLRSIKSVDKVVICG